MSTPETRWQDIPRIAELLEDCARNYPASRSFRARFRDTTRRFVRSDPRIAELRKSHKAHWAKLLADYDAGKVSRSDLDAFPLTVEQAIHDTRDRLFAAAMNRAGKREAA